MGLRDLPEFTWLQIDNVASPISASHGPQDGSNATTHAVIYLKWSRHGTNCLQNNDLA
jgi:hypothetical protein